MEEDYREIVENITREIIEELRKEEIRLDDEKIETIRQEVKERVLREIQKKPRLEEEYFERFSLNVRIQHLILAISVILLILTGLPIKFHESGWAVLILKLLGGINVTRVIHRVASFLLMGIGIYHLFWLIFTKEGRKEFIYLLPRPKDFRDFVTNVKFFVGLTDERPKFDRYSYIEKFDYWAVYWGMVIMIGSGLILAFHNYLFGLVPKYVLDIAREAHSDEALLATLAIVIWHWYNAHFNPEVFPMNKTIFTGKISKERMLKEHPLEYERIIKEKKKG